jgi:SAM-dependent methyltransferase
VRRKKGNKSIHINYNQSEVGQYDHKFREKALFDIVESVFKGQDRSQIKILDMACGRGELLRELTEKGFDTFGMDMDPNCVKIAGQYTQVLRGDYSNIEKIFEQDSFDMTISSHSLEHLEHPKADLRRLVHISRKHVLIALPNPLALHNVINIGLFRKISNVNLGHRYVWDHRHLRNFLVNHIGLKVHSWHGDYIRLFPRKYGVRNFIVKTGIVRPIEVSLMKLIPFMANSIIVLCEKRR